MGQLDSMGIHCNICTSFIHAAQEEGRDWARRQGQSLSVWDQAEPVDPERKRCAAHHCDKILVSDGVRQLYHLYSFIFICSIDTDRSSWYHYVPLAEVPTFRRVPTCMIRTRRFWCCGRQPWSSKSVQYHHIPLPFHTISLPFLLN